MKPAPTHTSAFYVVTEDGDTMQVTASSPLDAAEMAVREWGLGADPGYGFKVFAAEDAKSFEFELRVKASEVA